MKPIPMGRVLGRVGRGEGSWESRSEACER
jgi:hypothetical protein